MNLDAVHMLYRYNAWANEQVWACALQLDEEAYFRDLGYAWGSVHGQVLHLMTAEWIWFKRLNGESPAGLLRNDDFPNRDAVRAKWDEIRSDIWAYLEGLTADKLAGRFAYRTTEGSDHSDVVLHILLHVINHSTDFRAQILQMSHQLGGPTFEQDLIFYLREQ